MRSTTRRRVGIKATGPNKSSRSPLVGGDDPRRQLFDEVRNQLGLARSWRAEDRYDTSASHILTLIADWIEILRQITIPSCIAAIPALTIAMGLARCRTRVVDVTPELID